MQKVETQALVLYSRNYREKDRLIKVFTESFGKRMFFVKNYARSKYATSLQNFTSAKILASINDGGFSFIDDVSDVETYRNIEEDIFVNAHATYIIALADAAVPDGQYDPALYGFLIRCLELMNQGFDEEIITNIFELQVLTRFGVQLDFSQCQFCHRTNLAFDYSYKFSGCLCPEHYNEDPRRTHVHPNVIYLLHQFQEISLDELKKISVKSDLKKQIRQFLDGIYDEYVGIHLKAKKFLDSMDDWAGIMK